VRPLRPWSAYEASPADLALARRVDRALRRFWTGRAPRGWVVSCHHLARAVAACFPGAGARVVDGRFNGGWEHSWLALPSGWLLDVYPIARGDGTCVLLDARSGSPWRGLYVEEDLRGRQPTRLYRPGEPVVVVEPGIAGRMRLDPHPRAIAWAERRLRRRIRDRSRAAVMASANSRTVSARRAQARA
jgi:hypothetical protein